jgi:hypothetical protein
VCFLVDGDCECDSCEIVIVICVVDEMKKKKEKQEAHTGAHISIEWQLHRY